MLASAGITGSSAGLIIRRGISWRRRVLAIADSVIAFGGGEFRFGTDDHSRAGSLKCLCILLNSINMGDNAFESGGRGSDNRAAGWIKGKTRRHDVS